VEQMSFESAARYMRLCRCVIGLELREETFGGAVHYGVFCGRDKVIPRSTRYGPFTGKTVNTSEIKTNDDNSFMWEVRLSSLLLLS